MIWIWIKKLITRKKPEPPRELTGEEKWDLYRWMKYQMDMDTNDKN